MKKIILFMMLLFSINLYAQRSMWLKSEERLIKTHGEPTSVNTTSSGTILYLYTNEDANIEYTYFYKDGKMTSLMIYFPNYQAGINELALNNIYKYLGTVNVSEYNTGFQYYIPKWGEIITIFYNNGNTIVIFKLR